MNCQSCGMPMDKPEDHGGGDVNNPFCKYCTDEQGNLMPREQVRAKMIQFYIQKQGKTQEEAEKATDQLMAAMPAWKGEGVVEEPKPEETTEPPPGSTPGPAETPEPISEPTTPPVQPTEPTTETPIEPPEPEGETPTE